ncbi:MAG: 23S rRNA (pseudouridine(1915)-N(3))-methyltransferase RlmH [Bacilli bacterium]|nr:23S rRNA (pseudouridine(1915)-N(3))-methyltransferase RlmH [Bacilli bacterium]
MKIKIYAIGHLKEAYLKQGINEYLERLKPYTQIEIVELNDESIVDNPSLKEIEQAKNKEGQKVLKLLKSNEYLIGLDLVKKQPTSEEFAKYLNDKFVLGGANISFVIGGSYGLSDELKARCNDRIGLSNMTFLHQMTRLILLEQIYRAFKINRNEVYHK